jgi:hypothetical protein
VKKKEVVFYCPTCKEVYSASPRSGQICLICRKKAKEIPVLAREFNRLPEDQKQMILNTAVAEPAPVQAPPAKAPVPAPEATAFLPPEPEVPAAPVQPVAPVQPQVQTKLYGTIINTSTQNIRNAPDGTVVGKLLKGEKFEILERKTVNGREWGRCNKGWVCLRSYVKLEEVKVESGNSGSSGNNV